MGVGATTPLSRASTGYRHEALMYADIDEFLKSTVEFVADGVAAGEPVLVVVNRDKCAAIRDELGTAAAGVVFADMAEVGANPGRIIGVWHAYLSRQQPAAAVRGIGEPIDAGRSPAELLECQLHEALLNVAFSGGNDFWLLCPYDLAALSDDVIAEALRTHPYICCDSDRRASTVYQAPDALTLFDGDLPDPPSSAISARFNYGDLDAVRDLVAEQAGRFHFGTVRTADIVTAINELATNAIEHGGGEGVVRVWREGDGVIFEISDRGRFSSPLAGRLPPEISRTDGRGLWIANQLCDLLQIRTPPTGTVMRAHLRLGQPGPMRRC